MNSIKIQDTRPIYRNLFFLYINNKLDSQVSLVVKNLPTNGGDARDKGLIPELERSLGEGMATHSHIFAWKTQRTEEPGSPWGCKESDTTKQQIRWRKKIGKPYHFKYHQK